MKHFEKELQLDDVAFLKREYNDQSFYENHRIRYTLMSKK